MLKILIFVFAVIVYNLGTNESILIKHRLKFNQITYLHRKLNENKNSRIYVE